VNGASEIQGRAKEMVTLGFKPLDGLHLASAIVGKAAHFITVDDGILKKKGRVTDLLVTSPLEFVERFGEQL
jgi:hypothetical protein